MIVALGHSVNPFVDEAVQEILSQCSQTLHGRAPGLGILFTSRMDDDFQLILERILSHWPELLLVGCTTDGEISDRFPCVEESLALVLLQSDQISFAAGCGQGLSHDPEAAVGQAYEQAQESRPMNGNPPALAIFLGEGLKTFGVDLGAALNRVLGKVPVFGGCAGDHFRHQSTYQFYNGRVLTDAVVLVLFYGAVQYCMQFHSGWTPTGASFPVTRASGNILWEIDGLSAVDFFKQHIGPNSQTYPQFSLAVSTEGESDENFVLRDPVQVNEQDGSIACVGTFPENARIRLTEFSPESLIAAAEYASQQALKLFPGSSPALALLCPCTSRRHILGSRAGLEHLRLLSRGKEEPGLRVFGMYAYAEIGPLGEFAKTSRHNDTYAALLLGDEP